jgi:pilus assembly protein CpaE
LLLIKIETENSWLERKFHDLIQAVGDYEILRREDHRRPDALIYELGEVPQESFDHIRAMLAANQVENVFLTSPKIQTDVLLQAIKIGVKEFFSQPLDKDEVRGALKKLKDLHAAGANEGQQREGKIVYLMGSKGGVGTTTLAANLAANLSQHNPEISVGLLDMNMLYGEIPLFFDIKSTYSLSEVIRNIDRLDRTFLSSCMSKHASGVNILPSPNQLNGYFIPGAEIMEQILTVMTGMFDLILVDGGKTVDETAVKVLKMSDEIILASLLTIPSLTNAKKLLRFFYQFSIAAQPNIKIFVNRYSRKSQITMKSAEKALAEKIYWQVPEDDKICTAALNRGETIAQTAPRSKIAKNLQSATEKLMAEITV